MDYTLPAFQDLKPLTSLVIKQEEKPKEQFYTIKSGQTLTSIAAENNTTVERLWEKNTDLKNPDLIDVNYQLKIPFPDEQLPDRPLPTVNPLEPIRNAPTSGLARGSGNTYYAGQCVWYIKNIVPWVENGWGNASDWKYTSGHKVSSTPAVGTVGWAKSYGHVVLITGITETTVTLSEMNYYSWNVVNTRTAPISEFEYIYP